jgi:hypothetical protein
MDWESWFFPVPDRPLREEPLWLQLKYSFVFLIFHAGTVSTDAVAFTLPCLVNNRRILLHRRATLGARNTKPLPIKVKRITPTLVTIYPMNENQIVASQSLPPILENLSEHPFLRGLDAKHLGILADCAMHAYFKPGEFGKAIRRIGSTCCAVAKFAWRHTMRAVRR